MNKQTMQITLETAKAIYSTVPESFKRDLEDMFGKNSFYTKIEDRVKTFEDACEVLEIDPIIFPNKTPKSTIAHYKLEIIVEALNEGWEPNWNNNNEYKYYPWFKQSPSGFGFSGTSYDYWFTRASVGSRLCFKTRELSNYAGTQFEDIYKDFMI